MTYWPVLKRCIVYCVVLCGVWFAPSFSKTTRVDTGQSQVAEELHVDKCGKGVQLQVQVQTQVQTANASILSLMCAHKYSWPASPET